MSAALTSLLLAMVASVAAAVVTPVVTHHLQERSERERLVPTCRELYAGWVRPGEPGWEEPPKGSCGLGPMRLRYELEVLNKGKSAAVLRDFVWSVRDAFGEGFYYGAVGTGPGITLERVDDRPVGEPVGPPRELQAIKLEPGEHAAFLYEDDFVVFDVMEAEQGPEGPAPRPVFGYRGRREYLETGEDAADLRTRLALLAFTLRTKVRGI